MDRPDVITLPAEIAWLADERTQTLCHLLASRGQVYFVGGCVRDALLGLGGADVDIATDLLPDAVIRLVKEARFKAIPTGLDHGTITVVVDGAAFEVTTFRRDVKTDGRRAVVAFSKDVAEDARRRDFTLNALYATPDGRVVDPLGSGIKDCRNRQIRFIEDADRRIQEDYLRILRYFRFHARFAEPDAGFDTEALDAIARNAAGLESLSAERVGGEVKKLLGTDNPAPAVAAMRQTGCLLRILPGSDDRFLGPVVHAEAQLKCSPDAMLRLAALGGDETVAERLRLSKQEARDLALLQAAGFGVTPLQEVAYRDGYKIALGATVLRAAFQNNLVDTTAVAQIKAASKAVFPIKARDLMPAYEGIALGEKLAALEASWIASGFTLSREDLMTQM